MNKYLILRFSSIGDIVLITPVLRRLKLQTQAEVHVLTKKSFRGILENNPYVDKVITFENNVTDSFAALEAERYSEIIDLHHNLRTLKVKNHLKLPAHSFPKLNIQKFILVNLKINLLPNLHIVDRYMKTVEHLGVIDDQKGLDYFIPSTVYVDYKKDFDSAFAGGFTGFVIGGQHNGKMCSREKIWEICSQIKGEIILFGGPEDADKGKWIAANDPTRIYNAAGKYTLDQSAYLVKEAQAIITHDTGLMHIAAAFQKKIISLWGGTVPELGMYPYRPGKGSKIIEVKHFMRPSSKLGTRKGIYKLWNFMDMIPTGKIISALQEKTTA